MIYFRKAGLLSNFIRTIPAVQKELQTWAKLAEEMPEPLRTQALSSIEHKTFHCIGGSVYAHYPGVNQKIMLRLIVALQTISDYLDNLCDRLQVTDPQAFRILHQSFIHALIPLTPLENYYSAYPYSETSYLPTLVQTCQKLLLEIPYYHKTQSQALRLASYYCELQILKHVIPGSEVLLKNWIQKEFEPQLHWNEWAAASGSTLGIFLLFALGFQDSHMKLEEILATYFPWIQGLHILLDYLIDLKEDREFGDLNFITFYPSYQERDKALQKIAWESKDRSTHLPNPAFHETVVAGLIALYGSDPKVKQQNLEPIIKNMAQDKPTRAMLALCKILRHLNYLP